MTPKQKALALLSGSRHKTRTSNNIGDVIFDCGLDAKTLRLFAIRIAEHGYNCVLPEEQDERTLVPIRASKLYLKNFINLSNLAKAHEQALLWAKEYELEEQSIGRTYWKLESWYAAAFCSHPSAKLAAWNTYLSASPELNGIEVIFMQELLG